MVVFDDDDVEDDEEDAAMSVDRRRSRDEALPASCTREGRDVPARGGLDITSARFWIAGRASG